MPGRSNLEKVNGHNHCTPTQHLVMVIGCDECGTISEGTSLWCLFERHPKDAQNGKRDEGVSLVGVGTIPN